MEYFLVIFAITIVVFNIINAYKPHKMLDMYMDSYDGLSLVMCILLLAPSEIFLKITGRI